MNVKVKELKGKLDKSARRALMIATICGDDKFVAKVIDWNQAETYAALDKWTEHWKNDSKVDEEFFGDIANNAVVALKDAQKGKDSVERARNFLDAFTSLTFESKDNLEKDDYCNAVVQLRLIGSMILSEDKFVDPSNSRKSNSKVKNFKGKDSEKNPESKTGFFQHVLDNAQESVKKADSEEGKKALDKDEESAAKTILEFVKDNEPLRKMMGTFSGGFSTWIAEQLYGLKPEVVEVIGRSNDDGRIATDLFNQYVMWMKANRPNDYIKYLAESTADDNDGPKPEETKKIGTSGSNNKKEETPVYGFRPCTVPYTGGTIFDEPAVPPIGSPKWRENALKKIRARHAAENDQEKAAANQ